MVKTPICEVSRPCSPILQCIKSCFFMGRSHVYIFSVVSGTAVCDVIVSRPNRKQQFSEAAAHLPSSSVLPLVLQRPLQLDPEPVRLPGVCCPGVRVPGRGPDARGLIPSRQGRRGLLLPGTATEEWQPSSGGVHSRTVRQPPPTAAAATSGAGRAAVPPVHRRLPEETQPVPLPVETDGGSAPKHQDQI